MFETRDGAAIGWRREMLRFTLASIVAFVGLALVYWSGLTDALMYDDIYHAMKAQRQDPSRLFDFWEVERSDVSGVWQVYGRLLHIYPENIKGVRLYWRPWQNAQNMADWLLWGEKYAGWKLTSYLMNALTAGVLFILLRRRALGAVGAGLLTAIWLLHPARHLTVVWIAARADAGMTLFLTASLYCFFRFLETSGAARLRWRAISLLLFFISLGYKESALVFPFALAALPFIMRQDGGLPRRTLRALRLAAAWLAVSVAYVFFRFGTPPSPGFDPFAGSKVGSEFGFQTIIFLSKMGVYFTEAMTANLPLTNDFLLNSIATPPMLLILGALVLLTALLLRLTVPLALWGLTAFFIMLLPVLGIETRPYALSAPLVMFIIALSAFKPRVTALPALWRGATLFLLLVWFAGLAGAAAQQGFLTMLPQNILTSMVQKFHREHADLGPEDRVYFIHLWQQCTEPRYFGMPYPPQRRPAFAVLTFDPSLLPNRVVEDSGMLRSSIPFFAPRHVMVRIEAIDERSLDVSLRKEHFMDVPAARQWIPADYANNVDWDRYQGESFWVEIRNRAWRPNGYPDHLRFHFETPLCDPHNHFFFNDGLSMRKISLCGSRNPEFLDQEPFAPPVSRPASPDAASLFEP